jgi:hypothetical protein
MVSSRTLVPDLVHLADRLKAAQAGHADIQQHDVGAQFGHPFDCIGGVGSLAGDLDIGLGAKQGPDSLPEKSVVIG